MCVCICVLFFYCWFIRLCEKDGVRESLGSLGWTWTHCCVSHGEPARTCWTAQGTLLSVTWQPGWRGVWGRRDTCVCLAELLHCALETVTTLFIGYNPIKNTKLKKKVLYRLHQIFFSPQPWALFFSVLTGNHFCEAGVHCSYPRFYYF